MRFLLNRSLPFGAAAILLLIVASGWLSRRNLREVRQDLAAVNHTHQVLQALDMVISSAKDEETGERGFVITGDQAYLEPYQAAGPLGQKALAETKRLTSDNPRQQERLQAVRAQAQIVGALHKEIVQMRLTSGRDAARAIVLQGREKLEMDRLRTLVTAMQMDERDLLNIRQEKSRETYHWAVGSIIFDTLTGMLAVGAFCLLWARQSRERAKAAATLEAQRDLYLLTLSSIGDAVVTTDAAGTVTLLNPIAQRLTGWTTAEAQGETVEKIFQIVNESTRTPVANPVRKVMEDGCIVGLANHTVLIARDGTERHIDDSAAPILRPDGSIAGVVLVFRDITDRWRAERELHDSREWLRVTLASIGDAVIVTDRESKVTYLNPVAEKLTRWSLTQAAGEPLENVFRIINEETRETVENPAARALREGAIVGLANHTVLLARDGTEWHIDDSAAPIRDATGEIAGVVLVFHDISERWQAERQAQAVQRDLVESERKFRLVADNIPQLAWMARSDGHIYWYNQRWYDYTGTTFKEMEGWGWQSIHDAAELPRVLRNFESAVQRGEPWEDIFPLRRADGAMRWHLSRALPTRDESGKILAYFGTNTDITEHRILEEQLRTLAADLSEADRRKNEFIAMLAHELRNPLAPIRNAVYLLRAEGHDASIVDATSAMMERQLLQMVRLVDDILDVSRISQGRIELRSAPTDLVAAARSAVEAVQPFCALKAQRLEVRLPAEPIPIFGDSARLTQSIGNLLHNASKFTPHGGLIELILERHDREAVLKVRDEGCGMSAEQISRIFEMFFQLDTSLERAQSGLGIGLTLVKTLIEMHRGTVSASSAGLGLGSEFTVTLPISEPALIQRYEEPAAPQAQVPFQGRRVLVVDDNRDSAESLARLLRRRGFTVQVAFDGADAVAAAKLFLPEVALLDIGLPKLNGYEVALRLREIFKPEPPLLIALTGWGQDEDRQRSREAGFAVHLVKPIDFDLLLEVLQRGQ